MGTLQPGQKFEATVTVKATSSGLLENRVEVVTSELPPQTSTETIPSGPVIVLNPNKSVNPAMVAPGGSVQYTIDVENVGTAASGSPVIISERLPAGFSFASLNSTTINGATVTTSVDASNPNQPKFTVPSGINANKKLLLVFTVNVSANVATGSYCNSYTVGANGVNVQTGALACVNVGGGQIGDTVWRDWNKNGVRDPQDEGMPNATVYLCNGSVGTCNAGNAVQTQTTNANGNYLFTGLVAGTYTVGVAPGNGYVQTFDPDSTVDSRHVVTLAQGEQYLLADFGYGPNFTNGAGAVGDQVFDDKNNNGIFDAGDVGIGGVTVRLYEDTNGNGAIDSDDALVTTTTTSGGGVYGFADLPTGVNYLAQVLTSDTALQTYFGGSYAPTTNTLQSSPNLSGTDNTLDFGFKAVVPLTVGDQVFIDNNNNGTMDAGDTPIANVTVQFYQDTNGNGTIDAGEPLVNSADTNGSGIYTAQLPAGTYVARVLATDPDLPAGLSPVKSTIPFTLSVSRTDIDFPYVRLLTKAVDKSSATAGEILTYSLTPRYPGSSLLSNVIVTDTIPTGTTNATNINAGGTLSGSTITWNLGSNVAGVNGSQPSVSSGLTVLSPAAQIDTNRAADSADQLPDVAMDSSGNRYVVFNQGGNKTFFTKSTDDGATWSTPLDITSTASNNDKNATIAVDSSGNIHVTIDQNSDNVYYRKSTNGGISFGTAVQIDTSRAANSNDRFPDIAVSGNNVYTVFNQNNNRTYLARSTDGGTTWAAAIEITSISGGNNDKNAAIAVDGSGNVHVVIDQNNENVYYRQSSDSGATFSTGVQIDTARAVDSKDRFPKIAVGGSNVLHVAFNQNNASTFYVKSSDGGATWATAANLSTGGADKNVDIAATSSNVYVAINDNNDNVSLRQSSDSGATFSTAMEVDSVIGDSTDRNPALAAAAGKLTVTFGQNGQNVFYTGGTIPLSMPTTPAQIDTESGGQ